MSGVTPRYLTEQTFVFDSEKGVILKRNVTFVPGLYKIYDEILGTFKFMVGRLQFSTP